MIIRLLSFSIRAHWLVVLLTVVVAAYGCHELTRLPLDALPDITNKQVMINYAAPSLGPEDVEKRITFPIETAISGLAGVESTRSFSRNGYGQVTAIFQETANLYFMRQQVAERLAQAKPNLPPGVEPQLGPVSTGLGEVFMYSVEYADAHEAARNGEAGWQSDGSYLTDEGERLSHEVARLAYLRTVQDWILRPQLKIVPGVADIDSLGGYEKQYVVEPDTTKLVSYGLSYSDIAKALQAANLAVGANYIQRSGETYLVRADARIHSMDAIGRAVVDAWQRSGNDQSGGDRAYWRAIPDRRGQQERTRGRDRHSPDADRREQPDGGHLGPREIFTNSEQSAARHRRQRAA